jgi:hypothetical protein
MLDRVWNLQVSNLKRKEDRRNMVLIELDHVEPDRWKEEANSIHLNTEHTTYSSP